MNTLHPEPRSSASVTFDPDAPRLTGYPKEQNGADSSEAAPYGHQDHSTLAAGLAPEESSGRGPSSTLASLDSTPAANSPVIALTYDAHGRQPASTMTNETCSLPNAQSPGPAPVTIAPTLFAIPPQDRIEFHALPLSVREDIQYLLEVCAHVAGATKKERAFRQLEISFKGRPGFSLQALKRHYYNYLNHNGDWRWFIDTAKCPQYRHIKQNRKGASQQVGLPKDFLEFWHALGLKNKRVYRRAYAKLRRLWREGERIPGYGTWSDWFKRTFPHEPLPAICPDTYPDGWSYANLMRNKPPKPQEVAARIGQSAAREFLPHIIGTRQGLRFLEYVTFDDVKTDFRVLAPGPNGDLQVCDLWLLVAHDKATDVRLGYGLRPALAREDGTQTHLRLRDMKQLAGSILLRWGIPPYPVTWKVERGTATFPPATAKAIHQLFQGRLNVSYSSMIGGTSPAGYAERKVGNSRAKAGHEAGNNLLHNECGDLPAQTGRRYDVRPADLLAREAETNALIKRAYAIGMRATDLAKLQFPIFTVRQAKDALDQVFDRINRRTEHECEGFEDIVIWRPSPTANWEPAGTRTEFPAGAEFNTRKESPYERMLRLVEPYRAAGSTGEGWSQVHPSDIVHFFEDHHRIVAINQRSEIAFTHDKQEHTFANPNPEVFLPGRQYLAYHHPHDLTFLHLTQLNGGYVGTWARRSGVRHNDTKALEEAMRYTAQARALHFDALARRHADEVAEKEARRLHNETIFAEHQANQEAIDLTDSVVPIAPDSLIRQSPIDTQRSQSPVSAALDLLRAAAVDSAVTKAAQLTEREALSKAADDALDDNYIPLPIPQPTNLTNEDDE